MGNARALYCVYFYKGTPADVFTPDVSAWTKAVKPMLECNEMVFSCFLCTGVPGLITADMVKDGAAVIDVGINRFQDPKTGKVRLIGDVDFEGK